MYLYRLLNFIIQGFRLLVGEISMFHNAIECLENFTAKYVQYVYLLCRTKCCELLTSITKCIIMVVSLQLDLNRNAHTKIVSSYGHKAVNIVAFCIPRTAIPLVTGYRWQPPIPAAA